MGYALITGASGGIGRELAALFAADGHDLVITARSQERLDMVKTKLEQRFGVHVVTFAIDLSEANAPKKLHDFTTSQGIAVDHLVNNAGFADWTDFLDADWNRQNEMMQLNMHALAELTYRYGRDMRANGHGRILNISSVASMMAGPYMAMYFASKAFVRSLSEAVAHELRGTGVTVTCVCPGPTTTGFRKGREYEWPQFLHHDQTGHRTSACHVRLPQDDARLNPRLPWSAHQGGRARGTGSSPRSDPANRRVHERRQAAHA